MVFTTLFGIYGRILNCLGLKQYQFDVDYAEEKVVEGKFAIDLYKTNVLKLQTPKSINGKIIFPDQLDNEYEGSSTDSVTPINYKEKFEK